MRAKMMTQTMFAGLFAMAAATAVGASTASAIGVEELKPADAPAAEPAKADAPATTDQAAGEPKKEEGKKEEPKKKEGKKEEPKKEQPAPRSETSKALDGKLYLGTSIGLTTLSGAKGDWSGGGTSDFMVGYMLPLKFMERLDTWGTFRYQPISGTVIADEQSYRVAVHSYGFGAQAKLAIMPLLSAVGQAELAYCAVNLKSVDGFNPDETVGAGGVRVTVGGGAEWKFLEKILVGPRVNVGSGSFTTMEMGATVSLLF